MVTSFFVLEHIGDLNFLFWEIQRILKPGGKVIIGHFLQRREFEWSVWTWDKNEKFKIRQYRYRLEEIQEAIEYNFLKFDYQEVKDNWNKWVVLWYIIICEK
jgi:ubiquinone/menaquinone biosynthesis C-methylase UbiE